MILDTKAKNFSSQNGKTMGEKEGGIFYTARSQLLLHPNSYYATRV
jgi:hypothetical protein